MSAIGNLSRRRHKLTIRFQFQQHRTRHGGPTSGETRRARSALLRYAMPFLAIHKVTWGCVLKHGIRDFSPRATPPTPAPASSADVPDPASVGSAWRWLTDPETKETRIAATEPFIAKICGRTRTEAPLKGSRAASCWSESRVLCQSVT